MKAAIAASGETPLEYMLRIMRDEAAKSTRRDDMAKAAARQLTLVKSDTSVFILEQFLRDMHFCVPDHVSEWLSQIVLDKVHLRQELLALSTTWGDPRDRKRDSDVRKQARHRWNTCFASCGMKPQSPQGETIWSGGASQAYPSKIRYLVFYPWAKA